jgi:hypothetical protein
MAARPRNGNTLERSGFVNMARALFQAITGGCITLRKKAGKTVILHVTIWSRIVMKT